MIRVLIGFIIGLYCSYQFEWVESVYDIFRLIENVDIEQVIHQKKDEPTW